MSPADLSAAASDCADTQYSLWLEGKGGGGGGGGGLRGREDEGGEGTIGTVVIIGQRRKRN